MLYGLNVIAYIQTLNPSLKFRQLATKPMELESEFEQIKLIERIKRLKDVDALESVAISLVESNFRIRELYKQAALAGLPKL